MLNFFLNPAMLLGLAGLSLPVLAHLLSKKKYDIVQWGAMQFLELGQNTKRKIRLEELILLLLRMLLIALVVLAISRPWAKNGFLGRISSGQTRDVVFIIDGSYSMGWEGDAETPHEEAINLARKFLKELRPGDTVGIIDARDHARAVIEKPSKDFNFVREQLDLLPPPSGTSNLADAIDRAVGMLSETGNLSREIIVLTDKQQRGWKPHDTVLWTRLDDRLTQPKQRPRIWVVDVGPDDAADQTNFHLGELSLSREVSVPDSPIQIRTTLSYTGGEAAASRAVHLEINGQRLEGKKQTVPVEPGGEATLEFEYTFDTPGSYLISVVLDEDNLPGDNRTDAAMVITEPPPVLVVDGDPQLDATKGETYFLMKALTPASNPTPWVQAEVVPWNTWDVDRVKNYEVVILANVKRIKDTQAATLKDYVKHGGAVLLALGDQVDADNYNQQFWSDGSRFLPGKLEEIEKHEVEEDETAGLMVTDASLDLPWMERFKLENNGGFTEARFFQWWKLSSPRKADADNEVEQEDEDEATRGTDAVAAARLQNNTPLLLTHNFGRGGVAVMTSPVDADWSTLISKHDYVPLMHELIFHLASAKVARNVQVGFPLVIPISAPDDLKTFVFRGPGETEFEAEEAGDELSPLAQLSKTQLPGVYRFERKNKPIPGDEQYFVVNFDRGESDLTPLNDEELAFLTENERVEFLDGLQVLKERMFADDNRTEFWRFLLLFFLLILIGELYMTRRLVKGGHAAVDPLDEVPDDEIEELVPVLPEAPKEKRPRPIPPRMPPSSRPPRKSAPRRRDY